MPRNNNGVYTLPAGNPVATETSIDASWANGTVGDIGQELTFSLDRNGNGGMFVPFQNGDGTVLLPGITWANEVDSGFYRETLNEMRASVNGVDVAQYLVDGAAAGSQVPFRTWNGSAFVAPIMGVGEDVVFGDVIVGSSVNAGSNANRVGTIVGDLTVANINDLGIAYGYIFTPGTVSGNSVGIVSAAVRNTTQIDVTFDRNLRTGPGNNMFVFVSAVVTNSTYHSVDAFTLDHNDYGNDATVTVDCHNSLTGLRNDFSIFAVVRNA